jgi:serine/threonine-protein kinase
VKLKNTFYVALILLAASCATVQRAAAQIPCGPTDRPSLTRSINWPQFHFDAAHSGCNPYESTLNSDNVRDLVLDWQFATGGAVGSSPAVVNGVVYIGSYDSYLYALNAKTGALVWKYNTGFAVTYSPAVINGVVYAGGFDPNSQLDLVIALNARTGALIWSQRSDGPIGAATVTNGVVYVNDGRSVLALDAATGHVLWKSEDISVVESVPAVANGRVYVSADDGNLYALDASTGAILWTQSPGTGSWYSVTVVNNTVYVGVYAIDAVNATTGDMIWRYSDGLFNCLVWSACAPAVADGVVYAEDGFPDYTVYAVDTSTGGLRWKSPVGGLSSPAVANGVVYLGSDDNHIYALNAKTGAVLWAYVTGNYVRSAPAVVNGVVFVGSDDGNVYAFHLPGQ